ncbi:hypothetical protein K1719_022706 [Acacia pycnantha]|nr:hypothetical protein K1719_022706 [Acacia pycnantha]
MRYGLHLPRTSKVGNQVHQDDPVNEAVHDAFGVQDDNFIAKFGSELFSSGMMRLENFSVSWMRAIVLCIKVVEILKVIFSIKLYHIKCMCGITDKAMSMFWNYFEMLSRHGHSSSFYEVKKIINRLGLNYEKYMHTQKTVCFIGERKLGGGL